MVKSNVFYRIVSALIVASSVIVSSVGGGLSVPPLNVSAAGDVEAGDGTLLAPGDYCVPLIRNSSDEMNSIGTNLPNKYLSRAILSVDENNIQTLTIGVEHWSYYDEFAVLNQEYTDDYISNGYSLNAFPDGFFMSGHELTYNLKTANERIDGVAYLNYIVEKDSSKAKEAFEEAGGIIATECDGYFNFDVDVDATTAQDKDIAYVSFQISNYKDRIYVYNWFNTSSIPGYINKGCPITNLANSSIIYLDADNLEPFENIKNGFNDDSVSYTFDGVSPTAASGWQYFIGAPEQNAFSSVFAKKDEEGNCLNRVSYENGKLIATYYIDTANYPNVSDIQVEKEHDETYSLKKSRQDTGKLTKTWSDWNVTYFESIPIKFDNDNNQYIEVTYENEYELKIGKSLCLTIGANQYKCSLAPSTRSYDLNTIVLIDQDTANKITISGDVSVLPFGCEVQIVKSDDLFNRGYDLDLYDKNYKTCYSFIIKYNGEVISPNNINIKIELSAHYTHDPYIEICTTNNEIPYNSMNQNSDKMGYSDRVLYAKNIPISEYGFAILYASDRVNPESLQDGIYSTKVYLNHTGYVGKRSMADNALTHEAYIVRRDGVNYLYFNAHSMEKDGDGGTYYLAELIASDYGTHLPIEDSIRYTSFETMEDGALFPNAIYDPVTQYACVTGGVLALTEASYMPNQNTYYVGVTSAVMSALGNRSYEEVAAENAEGKGLHVWLSLHDIQPVDITEDDIKKMELYDYDISALTRQVELAKIKLNSKKSFSSASIAKVQTAYDAVLEAFGGTYDPLNKAEISADKLEKLGTNLENAIKALDSITVAGYNAQLDKDVTFDFYLSMNKNNLEAAQDGDLTANITKADGSTETVEVSEDGKIEFNVAPKEIGQTLKVKIGSYEFTYSVQEYLEKLIWYAENPTEGVEVSDKDAAIAKSLLVYGGYAQDYFVKKDAEANAYVDTERAYANVDNTLPETADNATTFTVPQLGDNIKYYGAAVVFDYTTDIRLYFTVDDAIENHSFAVNDKAVDAVAVDGGYYIAIENIYANQLGNPFKITVDGTDFQYGVYNYIAAALNATEVKSGALNELQALVKALYQYAELTKTTA